MKQETPLQKLITDLRLLAEIQSSHVAAMGITMAIDSAKKMLPYEREVIEKSFDNGQRESINVLLSALKEEGLDFTKEFDINDNMEDSKQYFEQTFKSE